MCAGICPSHLSFHIIYLSIYPPPPSRISGQMIPYQRVFRLAREKGGDTEKKGRSDRYPEVRWTISVRLADLHTLPPSATDPQHTQ